MKFTKLFLLLSIVFTSYSCSVWIAPPYTDINKILTVESGMSVAQVNEVLGINPYDIYNIQQDGATVLVYNYLRINRMVRGLKGKTELLRYKKEGLAAGEEWYDPKHPHRLFVYFKDGKVVSLITDSGRADAEALVLTSNSLKLITKDELACHPCSELDENEDGSGVNINLNVIPLNDSEDQSSKKKRRRNK